MSYGVLTITQGRKAVVYKSLRAASRALSGNGTDARRNAITNRCEQGGGFIGNNWVQYTTLHTAQK
jgi:hypothetical protein